ncbi:LOW QUALITY PROTEIN: uncharacterized protein LOC134221582 [Armigeres subalbatus]|uniref:LOW QUALITY PROTEIN: uncharacterized protein LOC134221582 n=1 Tax=Armigeres subalbatus TaxID=124917 RepID=UPI002ED3E1D9
MGVKHLDHFIRNKVDNGCSKVNIADEVRKYHNNAADATLDPPLPVIVVDVWALLGELMGIDRESLIFGARFNVGFWIIDGFLRKLKSLDVTLEFFVDGSVLDFKLDTWSQRRDRGYQEMLELIDAVDMGDDVEAILANHEAPSCCYAIEYLARRHGRLTVSLEKECDQELAAFACKANALAIISNDSDFLIYDGDWKYWSSRDLDITSLDTLEYNRKALLKHLGLNFAQMPLFATLCGNDIVALEELKRFHYRLGKYSDKMINVARFIRQGPKSVDVSKVVQQAFGPRNAHVKDRFQTSLDFYKTDYSTVPNHEESPQMREIFLKHPNKFMYQLWHKKPYTVSFGPVDMRRIELGERLPKFALRIHLRTAGIVLYHRVEHRKSYTHPFVIKLDHELKHKLQRFFVEFPPTDVPPALPELFLPIRLSGNLHDRKLQLISWIVSERLDYRQLKPILRPLLPTVITLCNLMENHVLQLFEADLLLHVAYQVVTDDYDPATMEIPTKVQSRPFRLVFFYQTMYRLVVEAMGCIGLNLQKFREDPPFDGVMFHTKYEEWASSKVKTTPIAQWRIYAQQY